MGRTKSWLALVLAIVMVLGMAVPAMAAYPDDSVRPLAQIAMYEAGTTVTNADSQEGWTDGNAIPFEVGEGPVEFDLYQYATNSDWKLNEAYLEQAPVVTFPTKNAAVDLAAGKDGTITITPKAMTLEPVMVTVRVDRAEDKPWTRSGWADYYFEQDFYVMVYPVAKYVPTKIELDAATPATDSIVLTASNFSSTSAGTLVIDSIDLDTASGNVTRVNYGTAGTPGYSVKLTAGGTIGTWNIRVGVSVNDVECEYVYIPVSVGNSANTAGYKINTSTDAFSAKINAATFSFDAFAAKKDGTKAGDGALASVGFSVTKDDGTTSSITGGYAAGKIELDVPTSIVKEKGTITINGLAGTTALLPKTIAYEITPVTVSVDATSLKFDTNLKTPDLVKYIYVTTDVGATIASPVDGDVTTLPSNTKITPIANGLVSGKYKYTLTAEADTPKTTTGKDLIVVQPTVTYTATATVRSGPFTADVKEIPYTVVNNTPAPVVTSSASSASLNVQTGISPLENSKEFVLTASNFFKHGTYTTEYATFENVVVTFEPTTNAPNMTTAFTTVANTNTVKGILTASQKYTGKMIVNGTVNGIAFEKVSIDVNVVDKTPGAANKIKASVEKIEGYQNSTAMQITLDVVDAAGAVIPGATVNTTNFQTSATDTTDPDIATIAPLGGNKYEVRFGATNTGAGVLKVNGSTTTPSASTTDLYIPVTVKKQVATMSPTTIELDMLTDATNKAKVTITANGTLAVTAPTAAGITITKNTTESTTTKFVYDVVGTAVTTRGKATFSSITIDGFAAEDLVMSYSVKNSSAIKVTDPAGLEKLAFNMSSGGLKDQLVTFGPNPVSATLSQVTVVSSDPTKVKVEQQTTPANTYLFTALADGAGVITVSGKVGAYAVADLVIPFTVGAVEDVTLKVTPNPIVLDLTTNKSVSLAVASSNGKTVTDQKINYTGDIVTISGMKVTAAKVGDTNVEVVGKVDGVEIKTTVPVKVTEAPAPVADMNVYINGVLHITGSRVEVGSDYKVNGFQFTLQDKNGNPVPVDKVTWKTPKGKKAPAGYRDASASKANIIPTAGFGKVTVVVYPKLTGASTVTTVVDFQALREKTGASAVYPTMENPKIGTRGYFFDYANTDPTNSWFVQPKYWNFKSSDKSTATIKTNGIINFIKGGSVTLTATKKASNNKCAITKFEFTVTIDDQYTNTKYFGAVLAPMGNLNSAKIVAALGSQMWQQGASSASAYELSEVGYTQMLTALKAQAGDNDITAIYIEGGLSKSGLTVGSRQIKMTELASDLAGIKGKIFLTLNGSASTFFTAKDAPATNAEIASAFAKVEKAIQDKEAGVSYVHNNFWKAQKFYVISATNVKKANANDTKITSIADSYAANLTIGTDGMFVGSEKKTINFTELYNKISKGLTGVGKYPAGNTLQVGNNYVATTNP